MKGKVKQTKHNKDERIVKREDRFPGIGEDALTLGVERTHLWRVLTGRRTSKSLLERYERLKSEARIKETIT